MRTLALCLLLCACTTTGERMQRVDQLKPGVSAIKDARTVLGAPKAKGKTSDGLTVYRWDYLRVTGGFRQVHENVSFELIFDAAGRLVRSETVSEPIAVTMQR